MGGFLSRSLLTLALTIAAVMAPRPSAAQSTDGERFWPHPIWGADDRAGGSNWITPEKVLEAVQLVRTGKIYEMGQVYERGMPLFGQRSYSIFLPTAGAAEGLNQIVAHEEFVCAEIGQVGTQFDGPGHIGKRMRLADGSTDNVFYNGHTDGEIATPYGLLQIGVENVKPIFTRGILIDIAGYKAVDYLPHSYEVTVADVKGALARQGLSEDGFHDGDAIFFRYGWSKLWTEPEEYNLNPPGTGRRFAASTGQVLCFGPSPRPRDWREDHSCASYGAAWAQPKRQSPSKSTSLITRSSWADRTRFHRWWETQT
jgi:hypothetical protein